MLGAEARRMASVALRNRRTRACGMHACVSHRDKHSPCLYLRWIVTGANLAKFASTPVEIALDLRLRSLSSLQT